MRGRSEGGVVAIILAGGASSRMGFDKLWAEIQGRPLVEWPIRVFARSTAVDCLVVVARPGTERRMEELLAELKVPAAVAAGGPRRQDSVRAGLEATPRAEWVVIHDGARPLVTDAMIRRGLAASRETGAAIAAVPATDTIKLVVGGRVVSTPDRNRLWVAQTPQVFRRSLLVEAHRSGADGTDDATLVEALGVEVRVFEGAYGNIKVTSEIDLRLARLALESEASGGLAGERPVAPSSVRSRR